MARLSRSSGRPAPGWCQTGLDGSQQRLVIAEIPAKNRLRALADAEPSAASSAASPHSPRWKSSMHRSIRARSAFSQAALARGARSPQRLTDLREAVGVDRGRREILDRIRVDLVVHGLQRGFEPRAARLPVRAGPRTCRWSARDPAAAGGKPAQRGVERVPQLRRPPQKQSSASVHSALISAVSPASQRRALPSMAPTSRRWAVSICPSALSITSGRGRIVQQVTRRAGWPGGCLPAAGRCCSSPREPERRYRRPGPACGCAPRERGSGRPHGSA